MSRINRNEADPPSANAGLAIDAQEKPRDPKPRWWVTMLIAGGTAFAAATGTSVFSGVKETIVNSPADALPITVSMIPSCEDYVVGRSDAKSQLTPAQVNPRWARLRQGATTADWQIVVQGKTDTPVVLNKLEIVDFHRAPLPERPVVILHPVTGCFGEGGEVLQRYFEADFDRTRPTIVARPAADSIDGGPPETAAKFPYTVSRLDPEVLSLDVHGEKPCICTWRLAVHWTGGGRSGTEVVERGSEGPFRTGVVDLDKTPTFDWAGGEGLRPSDDEE